ncbi:helix-turn-helix domain-containing protein [Micromonospora sp. WMMD882]|uniref:helix-turn-helix domain-containing protein n=1 Tax=Micromonospora sp. WMMD882 TaxID=3015151 RepID=UPI00248D0216|nr:helix-turn-helix domain-containing protein [Micromonospora sp. WMMD882]WBB78149.1 helix-turn-helix domain-containing protein [Micromonospora sp. WMMD882]
MNSPAEDGTSFADRLNLLFDTIRPAGRENPHSNKDVAAAIRAAGGSISDVYIWQLRTGRRTNPTKEHIESLAQFFGVSAAYFFDDEQARHTIADLKTLGALRKLQVQHVSLRTVLQHKGLSPASQQVIQQMVDRCLELEGLTDREPVEPGPAGDGPS